MATSQASNQELQEQLDTLRKDFAEVTKTLRELTTAYAKEGQDRVKVAASHAQDQVKESLPKFRVKSKVTHIVVWQSLSELAW